MGLKLGTNDGALLGASDGVEDGTMDSVVLGTSDWFDDDINDGALLGASDGVGEDGIKDGVPLGTEFIFHVTALFFSIQKCMKNNLKN